MLSSRLNGIFNMSDDQDLKLLIRETVHETLEALGMDVDDPLEVQQDLAWVRSAREGSESVKKKLVGSAILTIISFGGYLLWQGFKTKITG